MKTLFADALYWVALFDTRDPWHEKAVQTSRTHRKARVITTDAVLLEVLAAFSRTGPATRRLAAQYVRRLYAQRNVEVVAVERARMLAGIDLYESRPDKEYSLADCLSMIIMRQKGLQEVLTNDHHFTQEGFPILIEG